MGVLGHQKHGESHKKHQRRRSEAWELGEGLECELAYHQAVEQAKYLEV